ncbi:hypothetical protein HPB50_007980 [Hyalomma asiaticum]|uniref:Uncharacterized protein n=1 Tax=Hyalomma asiaticum TaxID=266040 RepID=A0ACB7RYL1_HYAAI|nr:hypothetical protein HPB50_007980 [Hyalomma asiaticum]
MSDQTTLMANGTAFGMEALMLINTVPSFTGDGTGSTIEDFLRILEQVGRLGGWSDTEMIGIGRCKMAGAAFDFAWRDENVAAAVTYSEFKTLALKRFDTEPTSSKIEKFWNAKQNAGEEVRSFGERLRILGKATLGIVGGEDPAKTQLRREILEEELLSRFTAGLRDPVRRFVLSHEPRTFKEAVEVAAREEQIDKLCARSIHHGSDSAEERELQNRLDRLEKLIEKSLGMSEYEQDTEERDRCSTAPPPRCYNCGLFGHTARECDRRQLDPRNESPDCQSTDIKSVEEAVAGRLEKSPVAGHGEEKAWVTPVDICGEDVAQEPVSDELEVSVMQWQVEMLANDEYGGESGDEVSLSCETPQMPTLREKGSERDEVGEKPREGMSESVAEIAPYEDEVALGSPEEAREEVMLRSPPTRAELTMTDMEGKGQLVYLPPLQSLFVPTLLQRSPYVYASGVPDRYNYGTVGGLMATRLIDAVVKTNQAWNEVSKTKRAKVIACLTGRHNRLGFSRKVKSAIYCLFVGAPRVMGVVLSRSACTRWKEVHSTSSKQQVSGSVPEQQALMLSLSAGLRLAYAAMEADFRESVGHSESLIRKLWPDAQETFFMRFCLPWCSASHSPRTLTFKEMCLLPIYNMKEFGERYGCKSNSNYSAGPMCDV